MNVCSRLFKESDVNAVCFVPGGSPYPDLPMTQEFYCALKRGYRMSRPEHAPHNMYDTQLQIWFTYEDSLS